MNLAKPFLYFVTPSISGDLKRWIYRIEEAVEGGVDVIQIRDKEASKSEIKQAAYLVAPLLKKKGIPLIINDHVDVASEVGDGVHLGQKDIPAEEARKILGPQKIIGLSIEKDSILQRGVDYIALSPIFPTETKKGFSYHFGMEGLKEMRKKTSLPIVVIGGIGSHHVLELIKEGATGIAVVSALLHDTFQKAREFKAYLK